MATVAPPPEAGLCAHCRHVRALANRRGSVFVMCDLAADDPRLRQYPQLPVLACHAFESDASQPDPRPLEGRDPDPEED